VLGRALVEATRAQPGSHPLRTGQTARAGHQQGLLGVRPGREQGGQRPAGRFGQGEQDIGHVVGGAVVEERPEFPLAHPALRQGPAGAAARCRSAIGDLRRQRSARVAGGNRSHDRDRSVSTGSAWLFAPTNTDQ
jgi:hypothetical protein